MRVVRFGVLMKHLLALSENTGQAYRSFTRYNLSCLSCWRYSFVIPKQERNFDMKLSLQLHNIAAFCFFFIAVNYGITSVPTSEAHWIQEIKLCFQVCSVNQAWIKFKCWHYKRSCLLWMKNKLLTNRNLALRVAVEHGSWLLLSTNTHKHFSLFLSRWYISACSTYFEADCVQ